MLALQLSNLLGFLRHLFALKLHLKAKVGHVTHWRGFDNVGKGYVVFQVGHKAVIQAEGSEIVCFETTLADGVSLGRDFLCCRHPVFIVLYRVDHIPCV